MLCCLPAAVELQRRGVVNTQSSKVTAPTATLQTKPLPLSHAVFPRRLRFQSIFSTSQLEALPCRQIGARLAHVLRRSGVRVLGDLNGQRVGDFAWRRNCGLKTLKELDSLHLPSPSSLRLGIAGPR
jgi:hypothetical protein